jgi:hypothetical protein
MPQDYTPAEAQHKACNEIQASASMQKLPVNGSGNFIHI